MPAPRSIHISYGILAGAAVLAVVAIALNRPTAKTVRFDIVCESLLLPDAAPSSPLQLSLRQAPTELQSFAAYGFDATAAPAAQSQFAAADQPLANIAPHALAFTAETRPDYPNSYLEVTRHGTIGKLTADLGPGVQLSSIATPDHVPTLTLASHQAKDVVLTLASSQISIDRGVRYAIPQLAKEQLDDFHLALRDPLPVLFIAESRDRPRTTIALRFRPSATDLPLLDRPEQWRRSSITFTRARNPEILIDGKKAEDTIQDRSADLVLRFRDLTVDSLAIAAAPRETGAAMLRITGQAETSSLLQQQNQLMPTILDEILGEKVSDRTLWIIGLAILAAIVFRLVDHAFGIILDHYIPKG